MGGAEECGSGGSKESEEAKRRRRLQAWNAKRKQQQQQQQRSFSLETDEEDDESEQPGSSHPDSNEQDPLDAFMAESVTPAAEESLKHAQETAAGFREPRRDGLARFLPDDDAPEPALEGLDYNGSEGEENEHAAQRFDESNAVYWQRIMSEKRQKAEKLATLDHDSIEYEPFRKNFYIEAPEIANMSVKDARRLRKDLDGIRVHGKDVPVPIRTWTQAGLSNKVLDVLNKLEYGQPMPIQAQSMPAIMSGRDCICVAKTGSGKTLAYVLPMLRHVKDQRPLENGEGPIALVVAPTRELVVQISKECKKFAKPLNLTTVSVYGGGGVSSQIGDLKRGGEIVVCTPGRMIDVLTQSGGRVTNLYRVTYLVLDEADRMFDFGFEPQISRIIQNTRPDRQTVMFSATFPRSMELLARAVLKNPVHIIVGGRSTVNPDIEQAVEIREHKERFWRLLELLGDWYESGKVLIFVHTQDQCDQLFSQLLQSGYPCLSLHGGKEQEDRESTISDFKSEVCNVLIATSIAARGLDVPDLRLVINYDAPSHREDYVHRVGRTGRAGNKGTAVTFVGPDDFAAAADLCKALRDSKQPVPQDLCNMEMRYNKMMEEGHATKRSGYGGNGFNFSESNAGRKKKKKKERKEEARQLGLEIESDQEDDEEEDNDENIVNDDDAASQNEELVVGKRSARDEEVERLRQREAAEEAADEQASGLTEARSAKQGRKEENEEEQHRDASITGSGSAVGGLARQQQVQAGASYQYTSDDPDAAAEEARERALQAGASKEKAEQAAKAIRLMTHQQKLPNPKTQQRQQQSQLQAATVQQQQGTAQTMRSAQSARSQPSHISAMQAAAASAVQRAGGQAGAAQAAPAELSSSPIAGITSMSPEERAKMITEAMQMSEQQQQADKQALEAQQQFIAQQRPQELLQQQANQYQQEANQRHMFARDKEVQSMEHPNAEMEINDLPQTARWKVTHKDAAREVGELTGCAVTVRGVYVSPGKEVPPGERKLYMVIEGPNQRGVQAARAKLKEIAEQAAAKDDPRLPGGIHATAGSHKSLLK
jgi:ATP-dependent RNA helicase DDX46/PRP5